MTAAEDRRKEAQNRVDIADADLVYARAELEVARANAVLAAANLTRLRAVSDARAVSSERIDTGHAAADATPAQVTAAQTKVRGTLSWLLYERGLESFLPVFDAAQSPRQCADQGTGERVAEFRHLT